MIEIKGIPGRVYEFLSPFKAHFGCAQGKHFLLFCWLVISTREGVVETAFPPDAVDDYLNKRGFVLTGTIREVLA